MKHGADRRLYVAQVLRFSALRGWSALDKTAKAEICDALIAASSSAAHAAAIADAIICADHAVPSPARILEIARSVNDPASSSRAPSSSCPVCRGTGYRHFWALATWRLDAAGFPSGRPEIEEMPRPASMTQAEWDVRGPLKPKLGRGQAIYEMVEKCKACC